MLERLQKAKRTAANNQIPDSELVTKDKAAQFSKLSFAKQYAEGLKQAGEITPEMREETRGAWVKYGQGTDPTALWASLQNKGTAWCTKRFATAETQLKNGDFHVFYTLDKQGKPTIPRIAIRMQGDQIGEIRGVEDSQQNVEGTMAPEVNARITGEQLQGAEKYRRATADMKQLTDIYYTCFKIDRKTKEKTYLNPTLTQTDLTFLYELDRPIQGFGYERSKRIAEIISQRNKDEDMLTVFDCTKDQIAHSTTDVNETTKAYVGPWNATVYQTVKNYPNIIYRYESFPDKKIFTYHLDTNPTIQTPEQA